ncbi:cobalamin biosynthesis protein [Streptomyces liangshanensis]|uniref:cobalamin biosynthesis protein n=1 Tax=Streptomyces liangshanensis TaxID=2717324 RepID=UPI003C7CD347
MVGVGARPGVAAGEILRLIAETLRDAGLAAGDVVELATVDTRAGETGITAAAARLGVPVRGYAAAFLADVAVPNPSAAALAALGTPSVAEAAALARGGELLVPKRASRPAGRPASATCAVARADGPGVTGWPGHDAGADGRQQRPRGTPRGAS